MSDSTFSPGRYRTRWFCYLDLLGFERFVQSAHIRNVMLGYEEALTDLRRSKSPLHKETVLYSWFSDTFIIYSTGDLPEHFAAVEQVGRLFFQRLILRQVPVRGAITHGDLYSQSRRNIFVGPALIDAYHHAENQNWLGFVLTPRAIAQLAAIGLPMHERPFYRKVPNGYMHKLCGDLMYGFAFNNGKVNGKNKYVESVLAMKKSAGAAHEGKYDQTLEFMRHNRVTDATEKMHHTQPN